MTIVAATVLGWASAAVFGAGALIMRRMSAVRAETVVRACHELRGSLTCVRLGIDAAVRTGTLSQAQSRAISLELGQAVRALQDLNGVRRQAASAQALTRVDVGQLVMDTAEAWRPFAQAHGAKLELAAPPGAVHVWGDRIRLAQATGNVIAISIEHGGGAVRVTCRHDGRRVRIDVVDDGPGLPAPVAQLARRGRSGRGPRGRGLAIASSIIEKHGGRLAAAPTSRGARVALTLPAAARLRVRTTAPG